MKSINFTKQLFAAALAVAIGFTGCQKNEMDSVEESLSFKNKQEAIAGACYDKYLGENIQGTYKIKGVDQSPVALANLEIGNNDETLFLQVTLADDFDAKNGLTSVTFKIDDVVYGENYTADELRKQILFEIQRNDLGTSQDGAVTITDLVIKAKPDVSNANDATTGELGPFVYEFQSCETLVCAHEKEYWKDANNAWINFSKVDLGYSEAFLRSNLNSSANKNSVKLLQSLTVASLNVANVDENAEGVAALKQTIEDAKALLDGINVEAGQDMKGKITPGLIGRLHQIPACE